MSKLKFPYSGNQRRDKPRIKIVPPAAAAAALVFGILINFLLPLHIFAFWTAFFMGLIFTGTGGIVIFWAINTLALHGTSFRIDRPATSLVRNGPFSFCRNPIYVGGAAVYAGLSLMFDSGWSLMLLPPLIALIHFQVVLREEEYLEKTFGEDYLHYKSTVPRWV